MTRTFIALELDESLRSYLRGLISQVAQQLPNLRWVDPTGMHLTLAFLGELTEEQLVAAVQATQQAARQFAPFDYHLAHLGIFGSQRQPRVLWLGIDEPSSKLLQLHHILNQELEQRNFAIDKRPFSPHLTLSRIKVPLQQEEQQVLQRLLANKDIIPSSATTYHVHHISVMKSELSRTGATYACLQACVLGK